MKKYRILKDFMGSQDGTQSELFSKDTIRELSPYLVSCVDPSWIEAFCVIENKAVTVENKAVTTDGEGGKPSRKRK